MSEIEDEWNTEYHKAMRRGFMWAIGLFSVVAITNVLILFVLLGMYFEV